MRAPAVKGAERCLVLTTSYPASRDDPSGHFVESEVRALAAQGPVSVLAAGRGPEGGAGEPVVHWLGASALFGFPGALERLRARPHLAILLPLVVLRALSHLRRHSGPVWAHWMLPFGFVAAASTRIWPRTALHVVAHGSDVRLLARLPGWLRTLVLGELARAEARLVFVSQELQTCLASRVSGRLRRYLDRAEVRPMQLDLAATPDRLEARRRLGLAPAERIALCVGRLIPDKRFEVALAAASLVPEARVVCVGEGPMRRELERRFPQASFLGQLGRSDTLSWIRAADVLLAASLKEGAPTVVREALSLGTPVVSVACGDLTTWAERDEQLLVVLPRPEPLAN